MPKPRERGWARHWSLKLGFEVRGAGSGDGVEVEVTVAARRVLGSHKPAAELSSFFSSSTSSICVYLQVVTGEGWSTRFIPL